MRADAEVRSVGAAALPAGLCAEAQSVSGVLSGSVPVILISYGTELLMRPLTPRWRRGHTASHLEPITAAGL